METVFTISGSEPYVEMMGAGPPDMPPGDYVCAQQVRPLLFTGGAATLAGVGAVGLSIYKFGQRHVGAGFASAVAAVGLWYLGGRLLGSAVNSFQLCQRR